jgi:hypothetical protein
VEECQRLETMINGMAMIQPGMAGDTSVVEQVRTYFEDQTTRGGG